MPDGKILYWYGYKGETLTASAYRTQWSMGSGFSGKAPTINENTNNTNLVLMFQPNKTDVHIMENRFNKLFSNEVIYIRFFCIARAN